MTEPDCAIWGTCAVRTVDLMVLSATARHPYFRGIGGFARRDAADLERIVMRMTKPEIERESRWVRLGRAMGPGLCAISVLAGVPPRRAAMLTAYGSSDHLGRRRRRHPEEVTR